VPPEVERYGKEYTALMTGFRDDMLSITRRHPLPPEPVGKADKQRAQEYRRQVQTVSRAATAEIAQRTSGWVKRLEALRPPPQMREFHAANVAALQAQEEGNRLISRSLAPGLKREEQERLRGEAEKARARQLAATERMVRALESAGGAAPPSMRALIEELQAAGE